MRDAGYTGIIPEADRLNTYIGEIDMGAIRPDLLASMQQCDVIPRLIADRLIDRFSYDDTVRIGRIENVVGKTVSRTRRIVSSRTNTTSRGRIVVATNETLI